MTSWRYEPLFLSFGVVRMSVQTARAIALAGIAILGALLLAMAALVQPRLRDELETIRARYGRLLVPVERVWPLPGVAVIDVADMDALARIAEHYDRSILHETTAEGDAFWVTDESGQFRYVLGAPAFAPDGGPTHEDPGLGITGDPARGPLLARAAGMNGTQHADVHDTYVHEALPSAGTAGVRAHAPQAETAGAYAYEPEPAADTISAYPYEPRPDSYGAYAYEAPPEAAGTAGVPAHAPQAETAGAYAYEPEPNGDGTHPFEPEREADGTCAYETQPETYGTYPYEPRPDPYGHYAHEAQLADASADGYQAGAPGARTAAPYDWPLDGGVDAFVQEREEWRAASLAAQEDGLAGEALSSHYSS